MEWKGRCGGATPNVLKKPLARDNILDNYLKHKYSTRLVSFLQSVFISYDSNRMYLRGV